jgi:DNA mismatch endonuclease (patch repair protein)
MMSGIRGHNTRIEVSVRKALFVKGFRYRLNLKTLPGKPDMVFPRYRAVILVHGCFWHQHDCHLFKWPQTRTEFWAQKIRGNRERDRSVFSLLRANGWRVLIVWECALKGKTRLDMTDMVEKIASWLVSGSDVKEIEGRRDMS